MNIEQTLSAMREFFDTNTTKDVRFRINALRKLHTAIKQYEQQILHALKTDLCKHEFEAYATEIGFVLHEISYAIKHIKRWTRPKKVKTPFMHFKSNSRIYSEPYGVVLIISPWNYPFNLTLTALVGAIAAGNCVCLKPSEHSAATSDIIDKIIGESFSPNFIKVIKGGADTSKQILEHRFDYIFFTGSTTVGKLVYASAAKNLTPVTLELGGKSPCIVDESAKIDLAAKRIIWGKLLNAGQTCVAPDHVYIRKSVKEQFLASAQKYITRFLGEAPEKNPDFPKIINEKHFQRLCLLLTNGTTIVGGQINKDHRKIAPTILTDITESSPIMKEEIFGPILPVLEYENLDELITLLKQKPKPLALYLFTTNTKTEQKVKTQLSFGGGAINDTMVHLATAHMPFGGVGQSGIGSYHGKSTFDTFSHHKGIMKKSNCFDINLRYPPYKTKRIKTVKRFMK